MTSEDTVIKDALSKTFIVISSFNENSFLEKFFSTIDIPLSQIIVVDQGSKDGTEEFCIFKGVNCLQYGEKTTFSRAYNVGIEWAIERGAKYICLAKSSVQFLTPILYALCRVLLLEKQVGGLLLFRLMAQA